jgi:serine protease
VSYPAIYPSVIAVGATDYRNTVAPYSNKGRGLDLVAPGGNIERDDNSDGYPDGVLQETRLDGSWGYYFFQGTSMASPHVAATAALLIANGAASTPEQVRQLLIDTARDLGAAGYDRRYGHGLVQSYAALTAGRQTSQPACTDADGDGYCLVDGDCNDNNPRIHPDANDSRGRAGRDRRDNDCNGVVDG